MNMENEGLPPNLKKAINKRKLGAEGAEALDWLVNTPPGDVNFKGALARANAATIRAALQAIADEPNQKTKKKTLEAALRKMEEQENAGGSAAVEAEVLMDGESEIRLPAANGALPLTESEQAEYQQDCETIVNELGSFIRVGKALRRIKAKKTYRVDFGTFEECVKVLFDLGERRSQQLMQTSQVMEQLDMQIQKAQNFAPFEMVLPKNEAQAAALLRAPEEKRAEVWQMAVAKAGGDKVTARHVANVIREEGAAGLGKVVEKQKRESRKDGNELHKPFAEAYAAFMEQVTQAYLDDWKKVSKDDVVKRLQVIIDYVNMH